MNNFYPYASEIKYVQYDVNNCCFSSLAFDLFDAIEYVAEQAILLWLRSSLLCEYFGFKIRSSLKMIF